MDTMDTINIIDTMDTKYTKNVKKLICSRVVLQIFSRNSYYLRGIYGEVPKDIKDRDTRLRERLDEGITAN
jgi:hypothetical protein